MISKIRKLRLWHKWLGILSAVFLINLGITGFILDHREWGWLYSDAAPAHYFNDEFVDNTTKHAMDTIKRSDTDNGGYLLHGGNRGLWWSDDAGSRWHHCTFKSRDTMPMITSLTAEANGSFKTLYAATNDGIWRSVDRGKTFGRFGLEDRFVNALTYDISTGGLIGVMDRSDIFRFDTNRSLVTRMSVLPPEKIELPLSVTLGRFVYDLHFGRGVFSGVGSWLWSDIAGIAMGILALSGIAFWILPKYYIAKAAAGKPVRVEIRGGVYQWMWRMHAPLGALLASIPILYLSVSGILIDHSKELRPWMKSIDLPRQYLPPVYEFRSLEGEIYGVASYPENPDRVIIGTRYGVFDSNDSGKSWHYEPQVHTFAKGVNRDGNTIMIKGMGGPDYTKCDGSGWIEKKKEGHGKNHSGGCRAPASAYVSWFDIIDGLHAGSIIAGWWKWVNDIFAIIASILVITGLIRWWRKKWL